MSDTKTSSSITDEAVLMNRKAIEHRAIWMGLIYDEAEKAGIEIEQIMRKAIKRCGRIHGEGYKADCSDPNDCSSFKESFLSDLVIKTLEINNIEFNKEELKVEFNYCVLVNAWKKLGFSNERIAKLCDIAMDGDRGIADAMGLKLNLNDTIADGCSTCKLHFYK